jgi:hypothetical protein
MVQPLTNLVQSGMLGSKVPNVRLVDKNHD